MKKKQPNSVSIKPHDNLKKISRKEAEDLFLQSKVLHTEIKQDKKELRVIMSLSSSQLCHITYNYKSKEKTYHLDKQGNTTFSPQTVD